MESSGVCSKVLFYNSRTPFFTLGFFLGIQLYSIAQFLPNLIAETKSVGFELLLFSVFIILIVTQLELGRYVANSSAPTALRNCMGYAAISYFVFVLSPQPFWFLISFVIWFGAISAIQIASGRIVLLSQELDTRIGRLNTLFLGTICGASTPKILLMSNVSMATILWVGIIVSALIVVRVHSYAATAGGYAMPGQLWFLRDVMYDAKGLAMIGSSMCLGIILGSLIFEKSPVIPSAIGVTAYIALSKRLLPANIHEIAVRYAIYLSAISLIIDGFIWDGLFISAVTLPFTGVLIYAAARIGAFRPATIMSAAERMALHNLGVVFGGLLVTSVYLPNIDFSQRYWGIGMLMFAIAYMTSLIQLEDEPTT